MTLENDITEAILEDLRAMGVFCFKHWGEPMGTKGVSDILGVFPGGGFLGLEVNTAKGRLTQTQADFQQSVAGGGGFAFMARDVQEVRPRLAAEGVFPPQKRLFGVRH